MPRLTKGELRPAFNPIDLIADCAPQTHCYPLPSPFTISLHRLTNTISSRLSSPSLHHHRCRSDDNGDDDDGTFCCGVKPGKTNKFDVTQAQVPMLPSASILEPQLLSLFLSHISAAAAAAAACPGLYQYQFLRLYQTVPLLRSWICV